jgi:hypothetical protein
MGDYVMATIKICDICGTRNNVNKVCLPYDRRMDGAGSMETISEVYDLCQTHELIAIKAAIKAAIANGVETDFGWNIRIVKEIEKQINNTKRK